MAAPLDSSMLRSPLAPLYAWGMAQWVARRHHLHTAEVYPIIKTESREVVGFYTHELGFLPDIPNVGDE